MLSDRLQKIASSFGAKASQYDRYAGLQKVCAAKLAAYFPRMKNPAVLEVGCGTGFVTDYLLRTYPDGVFTITDIAPEMIACCADKYAAPNVSFSVMDGQSLPKDARYDLIVLGMTAQWFDDPCAVLEMLRGHLMPRGQIIYSAPGAHSFTAWKNIVAGVSVDNGLLTYPEWPGVEARETVMLDYGRVEHFLKSLKDIGAHLPRDGAPILHPVALRKACRMYNDRHGGKVEWEIVYGVLQAAS